MFNAKSNKLIGYIQQNDELDYLISLIETFKKGRCLGILLYGPPGTGKTLLAVSLAESFNATYYIIDGSPDLDRRDIEGNWELLKGETKFNYGPLTKAINEANQNGISFIIINEINAIRESEQMSLNSLLSENHINLISKGFERHEMNPNCKLVIIGTMNKGVVGINKLQEAFDDRFIVNPEINFPLKNKEVEIATKISGCNQRIAEIVVDAARQIRKQATQDFSISKIFSTRLTVNFCMLVSRMPLKFLKNNIENTIINKLGETPEEKKSIAMILDGKMFESKLRSELIKIVDKLKLKEENVEEDGKINEVLNMKICVNEYVEKFGRSNALKKNGDILWKFLYWLWKNEKKILQDYFKLTERIEYNKIYKEMTGKSHIYGGEITLSYIKWLYRNKRKELFIFMKQLYPIF